MAANGRKYGFSASMTAAASKSTLGVTGSTTVRPYLMDLIISSVATPADNAAQYQVLRYTAWSTNTSTAVTPSAFDGADGAAQGTYWKLSTGTEPTYLAVPCLDISHNQRATFRWVAAPGEEIIAPATASNGIGVQCIGFGGSAVAEVTNAVFGE
jgi:hypothetical protein